MDRNKIGIATIDCIIKSLSARRAWIEIAKISTLKPLTAVALRKESVDRNSFYTQKRNLPKVALRKESVDRNRILFIFTTSKCLSLSARRAWIEIMSKNVGCLAV